MTHSMQSGIVLLTFALGLAGCSGSPTRPTSIAPVAISTPTVVTPQALTGYISDTGFRVISGARIEVLDGPQAGTVMTSDDGGRFSYTGIFASTVNLRATKAGYVEATQAVRVLTSGPWVNFNLVSLTPPVNIAGNYTLTITADSACTTLPDDVRTRSYSARVAPNPYNTGATATMFLEGVVTDGQFAPYANLFFIGVSGDYLGISTVGEGPALIEQLGPNRYVAYAVDATASGVTSSVSTISVPFTGTIEYCELKSPIGQYYDCSAEFAVVREQCTATNGRLTFTRR
jgi:hypothetical protein